MTSRLAAGLLLLTCALVSAEEPAVHKRGEIYGIDLAVAEQRYKPELDWLRGKAKRADKLELERVEGGLRVSGLARDPRYASLGLRDGDVLHAVDFKPVESVDDLRAALLTSAVPGMWKVDVIRAGKPLELMYFDDDDAARVGALAPAAGAPPPSSAREEGALPTEIRALGHDHYAIARSLVERFLANPTPLATEARLVPTVHDGKRSGLKLYAIHPGSVIARLGLENGDEVRAINDAVPTPDKMLAIYTSLRTATELRLTIDRRGRPVSIVWTIP